MFCVKCGKQLADGVAFCTNCGNPIKTKMAQKQGNMPFNSGVVPQNRTPNPEKNLPVPSNSSQREAPTGNYGAMPPNPVQKKSSKIWIWGGIGATVVVALAAVIVLLVVKPGEDSSSRKSRAEERASRNEEEEKRVESKQESEEEEQSTTTAKSRAISKPKATKEAAPSAKPTSQAENQLTLDKANATKLITSLCYGANFGINGNLLQYNSAEASFCSSFMMNSIAYSKDAIRKHYAKVQEKNQYLYIPEEVVSDYLNNSLGIADLSVLNRNAIHQAEPQGDYLYYYNGVYMMIAPDIGDYICEEPVITEMKKISDSLYLISGSVRTGTFDNRTTTIFQIRMAVNSESVWGGFTLSSVDQWDTYLFPNSDSVFLTKQDLLGMDAEHLRLARNELYARHGRRFTDSNLQNYFDSCNWYTGTIAPEAFNDNAMLNACEIVNRDLIVQYEKEMGYQ